MEPPFDPAAPENEPWRLSYFFERDGEQVTARPGVYTPFYATVKGENIGLSRMLADGWTLVNEIGNELDYGQAQSIQALIRKNAAEK